MEYLTNYEDRSPENIVCSDILNVTILYSKIHIFNGDTQYPLQKFWFLLPNIKIIKQTRTQIEIALPNTNNKFIDYLDKLDAAVHQMMCDKFKFNFKKYISHRHEKYAPIILSLDSMTSVFFDENNEIIKNNFSTIKYESHVTLSILIELSDIIIGENDYWINYTAKQLKFNSTFSTTKKSIFSVVDDQISNEDSIECLDTNISPKGIPDAPPLTPMVFGKKSSNGKSKAKKLVAPFVVSVDDLTDQINKMRNKKQQKDEEQMDNQIEKMMNEIKQFRDKQKKITDTYEAIELA
ncbi:MAG: hypothetical protein Hyperionvirus8_37 [Hyperionvirus sp.]|uniref:Uncharacterized protein n=1 Tax=Hyperionvirus sp. TaxID=2487770 RepID=A0A3G5ACE8_9VIRU|nr:MAG: hypothetical protein Hyperionvirus8_37 [Hyperionvirus sp.]